MKLAIEDTADTLPAAYDRPALRANVQRCLSVCTRVTPSATQASMLRRYEGDENRLTTGRRRRACATRD